MASIDTASPLPVAQPGNWAVTQAPAAATPATATRAAGGGAIRHVCTSICARIVATGTAPTAANVQVNLRDGASGAGAILQSWALALQAVAGDRDAVVLAGLNIVGSANTAMTLEFAAAGGANTVESVAMTGYSVS